MRRFLVLFGLLLVLAGVVLLFSTRTGLQFGGVSMSTSADASYLEQRTVDFLEDIRFKDFEKAATYHSIEDRRTVKEFLNSSKGSSRSGLSSWTSCAMRSWPSSWTAAGPGPGSRPEPSSNS